MSTRIRPFRKKVSTKIHCPRKVSIPILPFKSHPFSIKVATFNSVNGFWPNFQKCNKVDKNSRFLDENWFWIENSSTVSAGVVGVEILWKLFWTRMCFQSRQAGQHAARHLCGLGLVINNTDISILCRCPSSSSEICRQFWRKKWFCLHKYDSKIVRIWVMNYRMPTTTSRDFKAARGCRHPHKVNSVQEACAKCCAVHLLKYGFCKKSFQKNTTLNSWTLFSSQKGKYL